MVVSDIMMVGDTMPYLVLCSSWHGYTQAVQVMCLTLLLYLMVMVSFSLSQYCLSH